MGSFLAAHDAPWTEALPFILTTLFLLALPSLAVLALDERAKTILPKVRDWMNANSWLVTEFVIVFFIAIILNGMAG